MLPILQRKLNLLNSSLEKTVAFMELNQPHLTNSRGNGKWSALQIFWHMKTSEELSVSYLNKKLGEKKNLDSTTWKNEFWSVILKLALASPLKFKAPKAVAYPPADANFNELKNGYFTNREFLKTLLENIEPADLKLAVMKHPKVGLINIQQTLTFLESHFNHHKKQIYLTLKQS